jgi:signal transduction histidine kinase
MMRRPLQSQAMLNKAAAPYPPENPSRDKLLEQLHAMAGRTGAIAHDLNNMLGTMIGYGALVLDDLPVDDPDREFMAKVVEAGAEAKRLVAELLEVARIERAEPRKGLSKAA